MASRQQTLLQLHDLQRLKVRERTMTTPISTSGCVWQVASLLVREHGKLAAKQINEETDAEWQTLESQAPPGGQ